MNVNKSSGSKKNPKRLALNLLSSPSTASNTSSKCSNQDTPRITIQHSVYYQEGPACILPNLYLGAYCNARNKAQLSRHQISCIINVASEVTIVPKQIQYHHLHWTHNQTNLARSEFGHAIALIEAAHSQNQIVLVHCQQGIERSASLVLAFLMNISRRRKKVTALTTNRSSSTATIHLVGQDWSLDEALDFVQEKAPGIRPNMELLYQLREYEKKISAACPQRSLQTRTRRSISVGCNEPTATMIAPSLISTCALLEPKKRPRSASLRETSLCDSIISVSHKETFVANRKVQIEPILQEEKSRNKPVLALVCILVLLAAAMYERKLKLYYHNITTNRFSIIMTHARKDDIMKNNSIYDNGNLNHICSLFKHVYAVF